MAQKIVFQAPIRGLNTMNEFLPPESGYARELTNYVIGNGRISQRPAIEMWQYRSTGTSSQPNDQIVWIDTRVNTTISGTAVITYAGDIRELPAWTGATSIGGTPVYTPTRVKHVSLDLVFGLREPRLSYSPFTAWTFTTSVVTASAIRCGCSHKGRLYVFNGTTCEYSDVAQITGAMPAGNTFSFQEFLDGESILRVFSFTLQPGNNTENAMVIFGSGGTILVYQGDYPASTTWNLIGKYKMPAPAGRACFCEVDSDIFVATQDFPYWLRAVISGDPRAATEQNPAKQIENLWGAETWKPSSEDINQDNIGYIPFVVYEKNLDAIICSPSYISIDSDIQYGYEDWVEGSASFPNLYDVVQEPTWYVYFKAYNAWARWIGGVLVYPVIEKELGSYAGSLIGSSSIWTNTQVQVRRLGDPAITAANIKYDVIRTGAAGVTEKKAPIITAWKTPYQSMGSSNLTSTGMTVKYSNSIAEQLTNTQLIGDFSDYSGGVGIFGFYDPSSPPNNYAGGSVANQTASGIVRQDSYVGLPLVSKSISAMVSQGLGAPTEALWTAGNPGQKQEVYSLTILLEPGGDI